MNNLEVEIAELQKMIEAKRDELEREGGIIEEKDLVRQSVREMFFDTTTPKTNTATITIPPISVATNQAVPANASYLDYLDPQTTEVINQLISQISSKGVTPVIDEVAGQEPFIVDAFHDALVDKLYEELKERGFVK